MLKRISLGKLITLPKLKMKKSERVYDKEWNTWFSCEEERQHFIKSIAESEEEIERGDVISQKEMEEYIEQEFGISI